MEEGSLWLQVAQVAKTNSDARVRASAAVSLSPSLAPACLSSSLLTTDWPGPPRGPWGTPEACWATPEFNIWVGSPQPGPSGLSVSHGPWPDPERGAWLSLKTRTEPPTSLGQETPPSPQMPRGPGSQGRESIPKEKSFWSIRKSPLSWKLPA